MSNNFGTKILAKRYLKVPLSQLASSTGHRDHYAGNSCHPNVLEGVLKPYNAQESVYEAYNELTTLLAFKIAREGVPEAYELTNLLARSNDAQESVYEANNAPESARLRINYNQD